MQKINEKTQNKSRFGMKSAFVVAFVLMVGLGTAALLTSYGSVTGTVNVEQAVTLSDPDTSSTGGDLTCTEIDSCTYTNIGDHTSGIYASPSFEATNFANRAVGVGFDVKVTGITSCNDGCTVTCEGSSELSCMSNCLTTCINNCVNNGISEMKVCTDGVMNHDVGNLESCTDLSDGTHGESRLGASGSSTEDPDERLYIVVMNYDIDACLGTYTIETTVKPVVAPTLSTQ